MNERYTCTSHQYIQTSGFTAYRYDYTDGKRNGETAIFNTERYFSTTIQLQTTIQVVGVFI